MSKTTKIEIALTQLPQSPQIPLEIKFIEYHHNSFGFPVITDERYVIMGCNLVNKKDLSKYTRNMNPPVVVKNRLSLIEPIIVRQKQFHKQYLRMYCIFLRELNND